MTRENVELFKVRLTSCLGLLEVVSTAPEATAPEADVVYVMLAVEYARMALLVLLQSNAYHTRHTRATSVLVARYYTEYIESTLLKVCFLVRLFVLSLRAVPLKQKQEWCPLPSMKHSQILDSSVDAV